MERLLKVRDVVERTQLSRSVIYEMITAGTMPSIKIGGTRRVREIDLDAWIRGQAQSQSPAVA